MTYPQAFKLLFIALFLTLFISRNSFAKLKGIDIAMKVYKANRGLVGGKDILSLELRDGQGGKVIRELHLIYTEVKGDGDKSLMIFKKPLDIKNTKLLTWSHKKKNDDQWIYLPSFKRVKRISNRGKSASFMGSEFTYEDLITPEVTKFKFKLIKEVKDITYGPVWIVSRVSKTSNTYSKVVVTYSKSMLTAVKLSYYDRKNELLKISESSKFKKIKYKKRYYYLPYRISMVNKQSGKSSFFNFHKRKIGIKNNKNKFNKNNLK